MAQKLVHVVDYGMGNLKSVTKALEHLGYAVRILDNPCVSESVDRMILPGVGAIGHCRKNLDQFQMVEPILEHIESGKPFLGICLGMQILLDSSEEDDSVEGLSVFEGQVLRFDPSEMSRGQLKVPHMGWNNVGFSDQDKMFAGLSSGTDFYFVHSYYVRPKDEALITGTTEYGHKFCSAIERDNIWACQFHPEKSQKAGLQLLDNFMKL